MKRSLSAALALFLVAVVGLFAEGQEEKRPEEKTVVPAAKEKVNLSYWMMRFQTFNDVTQQVIDDYQKANPHLRIELNIIPHQDLLVKMYVALAGGTGPDMFVFPGQEFPRLMKEKTIAALSHEAFGVKSLADVENQYPPGFFDSCKVKGEVYGIPTWGAIYSYVINTDHFREVGIDPENDYPETWEDIILDGKKLKIVKDGKMVREPITYPFKMAASWYLLGFEPILHQQGGSILSEDGTRATLNSPEGVKTLQMWQDMIYKHEIISLDRAGEHYETEFANGTLSINFCNNMGPPAIIKRNPAIEGHFKVIPFPHVAGKRRSAGTTAWASMVSAASKNQEEAWKFWSHVMERGPLFLEKVGYLIPKKGLMDTPEAKKALFLDVFLGELEYSKSILIHIDFQPIAESIVRAVERSLYDRVPPKEALDIAAKEINGILSHQ